MLINGSIYLSLINIIIYIIYALLLKKNLGIENILHIALSTFVLYFCVEFSYDILQNNKSLGDYEEYKHIMFLGNLVVIYFSIKTIVEKFKR